MLITKPDLAGAQNQVLTLVRLLMHKVKFHIVTGSEGYLTITAREMGINCHIIPNLVREISPINDVKAVCHLDRLLKNMHVDIVHAHSFKAGLLARLVGRKLSTPIVFTAHGWSFSNGVPLLIRMPGLVVEKILSRYTNKIIVVSLYDEKLAKKYRIGYKNNIVLIKNSIFADECVSIYRSTKSEGVPVLLTVSRLARQKNIELLVDALSIVKQDFRSFIVGDGPLYEKIDKKINEYGLSSKVRLLGEKRDIKPYLRESDIFILSSDWEGLPLALIEALCVGLPLISTDVGGVSEVIKDNRNGFLVKKGDKKELADAIIKMIKIKNVRKNMGEESKRIFREEFSAEGMASKTYDVYKEVLQGR